MDMDEQTPGDDSTPQSAISKIVHDLANSANTICSAVQFLEMDVNKHEDRRYTRELIIGLKDECSRLNGYLEELRRLTKASQPHGSSYRK
jgi:nitrogen-specific signal transduction histidine kinase